MMSERPERTITLGGQRLEGVVFVPQAKSSSRPHRLHPTGRADVVHASTDDTTRSAHIRRMLLDRIVGAQRKIFFCSYLFADDEIVRALCAASERLRGGVYVLTALGKHLKAEVIENDFEDEIHDAKLRDRAVRHEGHLQALADAGVWLRSAEDCHAKFIVVDDGSTVVTSANATQEAYESNPEDALAVEDAHAARELGRLFAYVWRHLTTLESTPGARLDVHSLNPGRPQPWRPLAAGGAIRPVATLRDHEESLQRAAIELIDGARRHIRAATYSFIGMERHPVGAALARAVAREVEIDLLVQPRNHLAAQRATCAWLASLAPERVHLHGHRRTHTKSLVADAERALIWTGNLEAAHGWNNGIEVGLRVDDVGVATAIAGWTSDVSGRATHLALTSPTVGDLVGAGQPCAMTGAWTLELPAGVSAERVGASFERRPVELLEQGRTLVLCCDDEVVLDVTVRDGEHRIVGDRIRGRDGLSGLRSRGWLSDCVLRIVSGPEVQERPRGGEQGRRRKKGRRR